MRAKIAFMGTSRFSADILKDISEHVDVACVYTKPDAIRGRGKKPVASPVKEVASELGMECRTPSSLRDADEIDYLSSLGLDFICVAAYGKILPKEILEIPKKCCLNVHASLLPRWRGAAPIERAILAGDEYAGVCIMRMEEGLDTGDYCVIRKIPIEDMNATKLTSELASLGSVSLISAIEQIMDGRVHWTIQDTEGIEYASKLENGELALDPASSARENARRVKASSDAHPAKANVCGKLCRILDAIATDEDVTPGEVSLRNKRLLLGCADGAIEAKMIQPASKRAMDGQSFAAGIHGSGSMSWEAV